MDQYLVAFFVGVCISVCQSFNVDPNNRTLCPETSPVPPNRVYTRDQVTALRGNMNNATITGSEVIQAYIIPLGDGHGTGGVSTDARLEWISGFSGSSGYAIVTADKQALWTDGRYFTQADQQMDCHWILMQQGVTGYPNATDWLLQELAEFEHVGADSTILPLETWQTYVSALATNNISMVEIPSTFLDNIWTVGRPSIPNEPIFVHTFEFTGERWPDKMTKVREKMTEKSADVIIFTALDDIAWLYNLRGSDKGTSPLFYSYGFLFKDSVRLYVRDVTKLLNPEVRGHLNTNNDGSCSAPSCVQVKEYDTALTDLDAVKNDVDIKKIWITSGSSFAVYSRAGQEKAFVDHSPVQLMKSMKNSVEITKYRECQVRDSTIVVKFAAFLEKEIDEGKEWTELSASDEVTRRRREDPNNRGLGISFYPISAVGENAAVIHYRPTNITDKRISKTEVYLLDSGGQYLDGTTDVTRTFHYGTPTDMEKEGYTRVLMGVIDLATTVWPEGLLGSQIDSRTRTPLWQHGWDYRHGTGHGIGYFLNVHEGPASIGMGYSPRHSPLYPGMFFSDEPGFYEVGKFGIRLETIVEVVVAQTQYTFGDKRYLTFRPATLVPFEPKMIKYEMLSMYQRQWLNQYNQRCREEIGPLVSDDPVARDWLASRTEPIPDQPGWISAAPYMQTNAIILTVLLTICHLQA